MKVEFDKSFEKSLNKIRNKVLYAKLKQVILDCEKANDITEIQQLLKLTGFSNYYRYRIGDYRIGLELLENNTIRFIIVAHRKEIYRLFP